MAPTRRKKDLKESYIYLQVNDGLNDGLTALAVCTEYAIRHKRSILFDIKTYNTEQINDIFNFSKYPVPIYTNVHERLASQNQTRKKNLGKNSSALHASYPTDTLLVYSSGRGGNPLLKNETKRQRHIFEYIRFTKKFIDEYKKLIKDAKIPDTYIALHLRSTDRKLNIINSIEGGTAGNNSALKKANTTGNAHEHSLKKIDAFIAANKDMPVYIATDNKKLLIQLKKAHPNILSTYVDISGAECISNRECEPIHRWNAVKDKNIMKNAIFDLLLLAGAKKLMTSAGGFSRLAAGLWRKKDVLKKLLSTH